MRKRIIILLVLVAAAVAGSYLFYRAESGEATPADTLLVSGNIEAHESVLGFKVPGRIVELPVEEGQWVEAGTVLARLDAADYRQQVSVDEAALRVRNAELALALAGSREQEIEVAQRNVADADADLKQKELDFKRAQELYQKDVVSAQFRDQAETNLKRSRATFERAQQTLSQIQEGTRKEQIAIARANVAQAQERLRLSRVNLEYSELRAPKAGVVTVRQAELGEVVNPGTPVVTLADLDNVWLRAYVNETDLGRIRWGQEATLKTDTYPDKTYRGRISFIASQAEFTPKSVQTFKERVTLVYRIKIELDNPQHELKPGMPADATIQLQGK
ncbi:MAG TPA: HlyD family efflux transporter periplasmic adaptor subunit [Candidatus Xenobia bacterium]|nr:HlyD family efflux transporter periplasmic adaptor subunit [Candidatus Xenobia bacterium]